MADRQLVLAVFPDELAADSAAAALKDSGIAHRDAIGILVLDADASSSKTRWAPTAPVRAPRSAA
jgi:hypothetical protein